MVWSTVSCTNCSPAASNVTSFSAALTSMRWFQAMLLTMLSVMRSA